MLSVATMNTSFTVYFLWTACFCQGQKSNQLIAHQTMKSYMSCLQKTLNFTLSDLQIIYDARPYTVSIHTHLHPTCTHTYLHPTCTHLSPPNMYTHLHPTCTHISTQHAHTPLSTQHVHTPAMCGVALKLPQGWLNNHLQELDWHQDVEHACSLLLCHPHTMRAVGLGEAEATPYRGLHDAPGGGGGGVHHMIVT